MTKKENLLNRVIQHYNHLIEQGVDPNRILGVFIYGSQNYHTDIETSDVDTKAIYLPTFEEFCLHKTWVSKEYHLPNGEHCELKDIRQMRSEYLKQNINFVETLFTEYKYVNPEYEILWEKVTNLKDKIAFYNKRQTIKSIGGQLLHTAKQFAPYDFKKLYNIYRLSIFLKGYECADSEYEALLVPNEMQKDLLMTIRENGCGWSEETQMSRVNRIINETNDMLDRLDKYNFYPNEETEKELNHAVMAILQHSFEPKKEPMSLSEWWGHLTAAETKAFDAIVEEIGREGEIIVSKLVTKTSISRPVFNNLFSKMKSFYVAEVTTRGAKGMHIKFINPNIRMYINQLIDFL